MWQLAVDFDRLVEVCGQMRRLKFQAIIRFGLKECILVGRGFEIFFELLIKISM